MAVRLKRPLAYAPAEPPPMASACPCSLLAKSRAICRMRSAPPPVSPNTRCATALGVNAESALAPRPPVSTLAAAPSPSPSLTIVWIIAIASSPSEPGVTYTHWSAAAAVGEKRESTCTR